MRIDIITILQRAQDKGTLDLHVHDLRDFTTDKHRKVDDVPYGGGQGMVMKPEPFFAAVEAVRDARLVSEVLLMTPQGQSFDQRMAEDLAAHPDRQLIFLCGHYEGVDHRVVEGLVNREISIGDYVLTNGSIAAAVITDAVVRLLPGVLGDDRSAWQESFSEGLLEAPHYTRPPEFRGMPVPEVLLSGHHKKIDTWRAEEGMKRTAQNRPDLLDH
ncbi:MAG: tRNA (guanosine(37)-N1)-methyltransferase TrmD [Verrucomicrobiales bacterium]